MPLLLVGSYYFYGTWSLPFLLVLVISTSIDYLASRIIDASSSTRIRRSMLCLAVCSNLAILGFFKYFNFFLDSAHQTLTLFGMHSPFPQHMEILLPLGISYYTFEAISYVVDVYRGSAPATSWWNYCFYIMYFPHLIAGPIVRFKQLWPQYANPIMPPSAERLGKAMELIILGYVFKVVFANNAALIANPVYANPLQCSVASVHLGAVAFMAQLYFDFLGYTQIARGVSLLFNIELPANFNHPLHANNIANFWQRWQMTLSSWLHDYVFVPLGGRRRSLPRVVFGVFTTLLIAGIWHGAGWSFLIFGAYFGVLVSLYHIMRRIRRSAMGANERKLTSNKVYVFMMSALTIATILIGSVLFRAESLPSQLTILERLSHLPELGAELAKSISLGDFSLIGTMLILWSSMLTGPFVVRVYERTWQISPVWLRFQTGALAAMACWIFCAESPPAFIYFQF